MKPVFDRRTLVHGASGSLIASACPGVVGAKAEEADQTMDVTPPEDLMREHGVLNRVLLVYEAALQKFARA